MSGTGDGRLKMSVLSVLSGKFYLMGCARRSPDRPKVAKYNRTKRTQPSPKRMSVLSGKFYLLVCIRAGLVVPPGAFGSAWILSRKACEND